MDVDKLPAEISSLELQFRLHEEMPDTGMKYDFEFAKAKVIYQEYKKIRSMLQEINRSEDSKIV